MINGNYHTMSETLETKIAKMDQKLDLIINILQSLMVDEDEHEEVNLYKERDPYQPL